MVSEAWHDLGGNLSPGESRDDAARTGRRASGAARAALEAARIAADKAAEKDAERYSNDRRQEIIDDYHARKQQERGARDREIGRY